MALKIVFRFLVFILLPIGSMAQQDTVKHQEAGRFFLGGRNTLSAFSDDNAAGMGFGGQFRIQLGKHLNTEWFMDYITTNLHNLGYRRDYHIGWSVMFYPTNHPLEKGKLTPYFLAGHCFDLTEVTSFKSNVTYNTGISKSRFSSAVQMGIGTHYNITEKVDISLSVQYMLHTGKDIDAKELSDASTGTKYLDIRKEDAGLEGHLLTTLSLNIRVADLYKKK
jgi:opacity protein-like surface antigen